MWQFCHKLEAFFGRSGGFPAKNIKENVSELRLSLLHFQLILVEFHL